jgi:hypothetical protein
LFVQSGAEGDDTEGEGFTGFGGDDGAVERSALRLLREERESG